MPGTLTPAGYLPRVADGEVKSALRGTPAVVIEGPRATGKTWTGRRFAASAVTIDDSDDVRLAVELDPAALLDRGTPGSWTSGEHPGSGIR